MRTLIVAPPALGDAVLTQPLVSLLRGLDPTGRIEVLAPPSVAPVFEAMAEVAQVLPSRHAFGPLQPWGKFVLARRLDRLRHDRVFVLPPGRRVALVPWMARIPIRIGLHGDTRWGLINRPHRTVHTAADAGAPAAPRSDRPMVERYAHLAFDPSEPLPGHVPNPVLVRDASREATARTRSELPDDARLLVLCVGSEGAPSRRWPARHWASLIAAARDAWPDLVPVLVGDASDREFATEVSALAGGRTRNLCGRQTIADALATVSQAAAVVSHDCGLMHAAAAFGRPLVAVFGPTDPRFSPPRSPHARVEWLHQECSPCNAPTCRYDHGRCTSGVRPESVLASLRAVMRPTPRHIG